ncbi:MAG: hypothetical protein WC100_22530, partial [Sterolibacterium sp.]
MLNNQCQGNFCPAVCRSASLFRQYNINLAMHCIALSLASSFNLENAVERCPPFDTPAVRATQGERPFTKLVTTPFVLSALRS